MRTVAACPACRTAVPGSADRCLRCGHLVADPVRPCPACGQAVDAAARFCARCGQPLDAPPPVAQADAAPPPVAQADAAPPPVAQADAAPPLPDTTGVFPNTPSGRRPVLVGLAVFGAVIVTLSTLYAVEWFFFRPERTVAAYFDALADRDAEAAGGMLAGDDEDGVSGPPVLSPAALKSEGYTPPTGARIEKVETRDDVAVAETSFSLGDQRHELTLVLRRNSRATAGLFHRWRIVDGRYPISVRVVGLDAVMISGVRVSFPDGTDQAVVAALPGAYSAALPAQPLFRAAPVTLYAGVDPAAGAWHVQITPTITSVARDEVDRQVRAYLDRCAQSTVLEPDNCPFSRPIYFGEARNVRWRISRYPTVTVRADSPRAQGSLLQTTTYGRAEVTWQEVWGSGTTHDESDQVRFLVSGVVTVSGDTLTFRPAH